MPQWSI